MVKYGVQKACWCANYLNFNNCVGPNKSLMVGKNLNRPGNKNAACSMLIQHLRVLKTL